MKHKITDKGIDIVWINVDTGDEVDRSSDLYTKLCNLWAAAGKIVQIGTHK